MPCYAPDGRDVNTEIFNGTVQYEPCEPSSAVSMCCATGPGRPDDPDACVKDGLCFNSRFGGELWRESCTDPTWKSPACLKLFVNGTGINETMGTHFVDDQGTVLSDAGLTDCGGGMYCSGMRNEDCCSRKEGVFVLNGEQVSFDPSTLSPTSESSPSSTNSSTSSTQSPVASTESEGLSGAAKAGIGIGAALGVIFVAALIGWIVWKRRKLTQPPPAYDEIKMDHQDPRDTHSHGQGQGAPAPAPVIYEAPSPLPETPAQSQRDLPQSLRIAERHELPPQSPRVEERHEMP